MYDASLQEGLHCYLPEIKW